MIKLTREITVPVAAYHNDKVYVSIELEDGNLEKMSAELTAFVEKEYPRVLNQALNLLKENAKIKENQTKEEGPAKIEGKPLPFNSSEKTKNYNYSQWRK